MEVKSIIPYQPCAFCGGEFAPVDVFDGGKPAGLGLAHTEPHCAEFRAMDPVVFMRAVRARRVRHAPMRGN